MRLNLSDFGSLSLDVNKEASTELLEKILKDKNLIDIRLRLDIKYSYDITGMSL